MAVKILLLSGGLDSTALAFWMRPQITLTIDYGQRAAAGELRAASAISQELGIEHHAVRVDASAIGVGTMVGKPSSRSDLPPEWWPFRNQFLATVAAMRFAEMQSAQIMFGTVSGDSAHCDGKPEFIATLNQLFQSQKPYFSVTAPALAMTAAELLIAAEVPDSVLGWTFSCHVSNIACGTCRGCSKHIEARTLAGRAPPT